MAGAQNTTRLSWISTQFMKWAVVTVMDESAPQLPNAVRIWYVQLNSSSEIEVLTNGAKSNATAGPRIRCQMYSPTMMTVSSMKNSVGAKRAKPTCKDVCSGAQVSEQSSGAIRVPFRTHREVQGRYQSQPTRAVGN